MDITAHGPGEQDELTQERRGTARAPSSETRSSGRPALERSLRNHSGLCQVRAHSGQMLMVVGPGGLQKSPQVSLYLCALLLPSPR